jgi:mannitol-1-phosphate 5-dehydrogenase
MTQTSLHFGAGALGRGLILPLLAAHQVPIAIADINAAVVDRILAEGGYPIAISDDGRRENVFVPVAQAFALGRDDAALDAFIADADFVTTSVQIGNLGSVVKLLTSVWQSSDRRRTVIGCENLRKVGAEVRALFEAEDKALASRIFTPDCVIDRICSASPPELLIETERYTEWVIEAADDPGLRGPDVADDVDRLFFRKRYLVNTLADAASFIGLRKGHAYLHQAVTDPEILSQVAPLLALLRSHLIRVFGFGPGDIADYQALSVARLGNPSISRRIETVARDPWRKFGPTERFVEPIIAEFEAGVDVGDALAAMRAIIASVEPDPPMAAAQLSASWQTMATHDLFYRIVAARRERA